MDFDKNKDIYKEYQDVSDELLDPICDPQMDLSIKYELYVSKYKYLKILQKDCMKSINQNKLVSLLRPKLDLYQAQKFLHAHKPRAVNV